MESTHERGGRAALLVALLAIPSLLTCSDGSSSARPRNIVLLMLDTVRADRLTPYGYDRDTTPHLAALAERATLFERAHASAPWTVPSIASIFTGLPPTVHRAGIEGDGPRKFHPEDAFYGFDEDLPTLISGMRAAGMETAACISNPLVAIPCFSKDFARLKVERADAHGLVEWGIERLEEYGDRPFFLYLHFMDAHVPLAPPLRHVRRFASESMQALDDGELSTWVEKASRWGRFKKVARVDQPALNGFRDAKRMVYDAALAYLDEELGRLFAALEELGRDQDTLVVVTADHGEEFWEHWQEQVEGYDTGARSHIGCAHGHTLFQELLHVPLIVAGPGARPGHRVRGRVALADIGPTLLELAGQAPRLGLAASLRTCLQGGEAEEKPLLAESIAHGYELKSMVSPEGYKLIRATHAGERDLLFDLESDPDEANDLSREQAARGAAMKSQLDATLRRLRDARGTRGSSASEIPRDTLEDLGYAGDE